jgi:phosphoglycerol transferase MdoB-like AlkP superfamily enzyme
LFFLFQAEFYFFEEYTSRFNTVAIDYLHYWTEVSGNISAMYPVKRIIALCLLGATGVTLAVRRWAWPGAVTGVKTRLAHLGGWLLATGALLAGATQINFQGSSERLLNEIASNGLTGGTVAIFTRDLDYAHFFPTLSREESFVRARKLLDTPGAVWSSDPFSLQRRIPGDPARKKLNVIVLAQESFGSEFWGCLNLQDGKPPHKSLTPKLDAIAEKEGLLFTHLFADGNRTVRGMEAIFASFPPLPGDAILARNKSQNCETLASVLDRDGYSTTFIYPGRGLFDDMEPFMLANGFQRFISGPDFSHPTFSTVWGHCDEDLYDRALEEARAAHQSGQPFFIATMSVSNHQPFVFPKNKVDPKLKGHKAGARYSDLAVSRFIEQARKEPFWQASIIAIVSADGARVYGSQTVPVLSYEIPLLIVGPAAVQHSQRIDTAGCQLDVAPTILGLIGRPYDSVFYGRDLLTPAAERFALLNHNRSIAIYREPELVALSLGKVVERFTRADRHTLIKQGLDAATQEAAKDATALFQTADELYRERRYTISREAQTLSDRASLNR